MLKRKATKAEEAAWERLARARSEFAEARDGYEQASDERIEAVGAAFAAGLTTAEIIDALKENGENPLSRQRVHVMLQQAEQRRASMATDKPKKAALAKKAQPVKQPAKRATPAKRASRKTATVVDPGAKYGNA